MMTLLIGAFRLRVYWKMLLDPVSGIVDQKRSEMIPPHG